MSMFKQVQTSLGGRFKATDPENLSAAAVLVEPHKVIDIPKQNGGSFEAIEADWTVFQGPEQLRGEVEPVVHAKASSGGAVIVRSLRDLIGEMTLVTFRTVPNRQGGNPIPVVDNVTDPQIIEAVEAYVKRRDEAGQDALADLGL